MSSSRKPCADCGRPMSSVAVRCPHCGAFQPRAGTAGAPPTSSAPATAAPPASPAPRPAPRLSPEEARALLSISAAARGDDVEGPEDEPGVFAGLVLPHPRSIGLVRAIEIVLTALAIPLVATSMLALAMMWLRLLRVGGVRTRPGTLRIVGMVAGAGALYSFTRAAGVSNLAACVLVALQLFLLGMRAALRSAAKQRRRAAFDLTR